MRQITECTDAVKCTDQMKAQRQQEREREWLTWPIQRILKAKLSPINKENRTARGEDQHSKAEGWQGHTNSTPHNYTAQLAKSHSQKPQ